MNWRVSPQIATASAAFAAGLVCELSTLCVSEAWGFAPLALLTTRVGFFAILGGAVLAARGWRVPLTLGLLALAGVVTLPRLTPAGPRLELLSLALPWLGAASSALLAPLNPALRRATPAHALIAGLGIACAALVPTAAAVGIAAVAAGLGLAVEPALAHLAPRRRPAFSPRELLVLGPAIFAATAAYLLRPALAPTPSSLLALTLGAAIGLALPASLWLALAGALLAGWQAWLALDGGAGGLLPFWLLGLAGGAGVAATRLSARGALLLLAVPFTVVPLVQSLPSEWQARGARATAAAPRDTQLRARLDLARTGDADFTSWSAAGAAQRWLADRSRVLELDGAVTGASARARGSERLAGVLAGCLTEDRGRVRLVGDDQGAALLGIEEQGFAGADVAMIDAALATALAEENPQARRAWLSPEHRLFRVPGALLLAAGGEAAAVVQVQRTGWNDGRSAWPDSRMVARVARALSNRGAYVLVLPGLDVDTGALRDAMHAVAASFPVSAVFLPPEGVESLILVGASAPFSPNQFRTCHEASRTSLRALGLPSVDDLASLGVADLALVASTLPFGAPPGLAMPVVQSVLPATELGIQTGSVGAVFAPGFGPAAEARRATRRGSMDVLRASARGEVAEALERAHALADEPGASTALDPIVSPLLDRARRAADAARAEGKDSARWQEAESSVAAALLMHPGSAKARCLGAEIALLRKRLDEAATGFTACAEADPSRWEGWEGSARVAQLRGDLPAAEAAMRRAVAASPERWAGPLNLGLILFRQGKLEEAETWMKRAQEASADDQAADATRPHLALAMLYLQTDRAQLALLEARRAEADNASADAAYWTGEALYASGAVSDAEAAFRTALQRDPRHVSANHGLGLCLARRGDREGAAAAFRAVLAADPKHAAARQNLDLLRPSTPAPAPAP